NVINDGYSSVTVKATVLPSKYYSEPVVVQNDSQPHLVILNIQVPHSKSPGQEKIGTIVITYSSDSSNTVLSQAELNQETLSMLDLAKLNVKYVDAEGKTKKDDFTSDDDSYQLENEVKPYTDLIFTFDLQNLFDKDYGNNGELENIELNVDVDNTDLLKDGFEDKYTIENIEAGKEGKFTLTLLTNEEVEADTYTLEFTVTAEDGEGIEYEIKKELEVEIQLDDDDIRIIKAVPETATICNKEVFLAVEVHNFGSDDQDKVKVTLVNTELGLNQMIENIVIDAHTEDDDSWQKTFTIALENAKAKIYFLDLKTYIGSTLTDAEVVQLELKPCVAAEEPVVEEETESPLAQPEEKTTEKPTAKTETITGNVVKSIEKIPYTSNDYLVALMLIAIAVVAAMIVLMLVILFKEQ
ncbi:MAG: hypothetical protein AABX24_00735, partial [Nanoarchaeota archaeon]